MKKVILKKELICPFNKCRTAYCQDKDGNEFYKEMGAGCESCEYVWNISTIVIERPFIEEDSKECKEYELLHTVKSIDEGDVDISDDCKDLQLQDIQRIIKN